MVFPGEFLLSTVISSLVNAALEPVARAINHGTNRAMPNQFPFWQEIIKLRWANHLNKEQYQTIMRALGFDEPLAESMFEADHTPFALPDTVNLYRRGELDDIHFKQFAREAGVPENRLDTLQKALKYYPPVPDLIHFAVREAYTPEVVDKFKLMEDLPPKFIEEAKKAGLDEETAGLYWRAHWQLPSVQMGYEMLHRQIINNSELELLLRTQDVMPFWREKLINMSYSPFTRVDVRRMYKLGILNPEEVFKAYQDIGYNEFNATKLTEFTIMDVAEKERDLTKAEILKLIGYQEISLEEGAELLFKMGYDRAEAEYLITLELAKTVKQDTTDKIKIYTAEYIDGIIDDGTLAELLRQLALSATAIERILGEARIKKRKSIKLLSKDDIEKAYSIKVIERDEAFNRLLMHNIPKADAEILLAIIDKKLGEVK